MVKTKVIVKQKRNAGSRMHKYILQPPSLLMAPGLCVGASLGELVLRVSATLFASKYGSRPGGGRLCAPGIPVRTNRGAVPRFRLCLRAWMWIPGLYSWFSSVSPFLLRLRLYEALAGLKGQPDFGRLPRISRTYFQSSSWNLGLATSHRQGLHRYVELVIESVS